MRLLQLRLVKYGTITATLISNQICRERERDACLGHTLTHEDTGRVHQLHDIVCAALC